MRNRRYFLSQLIMLTFQCLLYISLFASFFGIMSITNPQIINISRTAATTMATFAIIMIILTVVYGGYNIVDKKPRSVFSSIFIATLFSDVVTYLQLQIMNVNPANNDRLILGGEDLALLGLVILLQMGLTYFFVMLGNHFFFKINPPQRCCIITSSQEQATHVAEKISTFRRRFLLCDVAHYECPDLKTTIKNHDVVFLAGIPDTEEAQLETLCYNLNKTIYLLAELEDVIISTAEQSILDDTPFLYIHRVEPTLLQRIVKRLMDIVISIVGLVLTSPIMLIAALLVSCTSKGPVFFRQDRKTIHGDIFKIFKFRTMYVEDEGNGQQVSARKDDSRITPVGNFLRKYRIDEIPQLFNVLRGEMSIVGPRPEMLENIVKYEQEVPEFKYRQQMKAGITGLAQIDGKYSTSPKDKAILDLMYIEKFSLAMDLKLMLRTLTIFFRRDSAEGFGSGKKVKCPQMRTSASVPPQEASPLGGGGNAAAKAASTSPSQENALDAKDSATPPGMGQEATPKNTPPKGDALMREA